MSKNILLTGGAGFIGSHTVEEILTQTDMTVTIIDRLSYAGNLHRLTTMECWEKERSRVQFLYHDFRSEFSDSIISKLETKPDYIIHMGAETHVYNSFTQPREFAFSNVIGTINMLELSRKLEPEKFIYVGTDEVYGAVVENQLHLEGEPHRPSNPYAASKSGAEAYVHAYWKSFGVPVIFTNTMNNFGERQDREKYIPKTIYNIYKGNEVDIHCALDDEGNVVDISSRCWLHARNHANGLIYLLDYAEIGGRYNIVGVRKNVYEIAQMLQEFLPVKRVLKENFLPFHAYSPGHDMHYGLDGNKMKSIGWIPPVDFENSLRKTVEWTFENSNWM